MRALLLAVLLLAPLAVADHGVGRCDSGVPSFGVIQVGDGTPERTFYVDDRNYLLANGIWIYMESNGVFVQWDRREPDPSLRNWWEYATFYGSAHDNLQRGGEAFTNPYVPDELGWDYGDVCADPDPAGPDMLVF